MVFLPIIHMAVDLSLKDEAVDSRTPLEALTERRPNVPPHSGDRG